ncbi:MULTISPECIES: glycosyltransferase family 2 protein [Enterobacter]|uniref:Glycosyltransferase family 2 protein n=1 Tax=Enterobacter vonholyi TaxID=2797505 RepID=A0ABU6E8H4_9ENTR|nr:MULTISPECIES: glycosyltransferase family 2 protein [Enterobacter]MEB6411472.1 glycosyltransferase family 2 protein [Enterobacter vonholyi]QBN08565.1 glycosyltransferase family 2 protein [Enterobacter cloacae complex sp.]THC25561.1 glycosyltransferase family 2 protein [Enterobacter sp. AD2-3]
MAFLSIIIAAHNAKDTLHATLESLQNAIDGAGNDVEIIIFNDSSNDSTQDIIEAWLPAFPNAQSRYVEYRNVGHVRNSALSLASGEYITMLDSDDRLKPGSIRDAVAFLKKERPDMLLTRLLEIRDTKKITADWQDFSPVALSQHEAIKRFLQHKDFQAHLIGQFMHRKLYANNPIPSMICYEDFAVFPGMLMQSSKIVYQRQGHYYYIKRSDSLSSRLDASKIAMLVECTLQMEKTFPPSFRHLVNCHWFDIYSNHRKHLTDQQLKLVKQRVNALYSFSFFFSRDVRFSYKKRVIEALWKK